jgi:hypothetical protein
MLLAIPRTIRKKENLGPLETTAYREKGAEYPKCLYQIYIHDGTAIVARCDDIYKNYEKFYDLYVLGPAVDVAIEFDGYWERVSAGEGERQYEFVSEPEPWLFRRLADGDLVAQKGEHGEPIVLATEVTGRIFALRGWKNVLVTNLDHGLIIAYLKLGVLCYRTLAEQPDGSIVWESEKEIDVFPGSVSDFTIFRATDYRTGIMAEVNGAVWAAVTSRNWAGIAIRAHTIKTRGTGLYVDFINVDYKQGYNPDHTIIAAGEILTVAMWWGVAENSFKSAENDGPTTIHAVCEHFLTDLAAADFIVIDEDEVVFSVSSIVAGATPFDITLTVDDLSYANQSLAGEGDLTLKFLGTGTTKGEIGQDVDPFEITFTPEGLEFIALDPPEVEAIWNE